MLHTPFSDSETFNKSGPIYKTVSSFELTRGTHGRFKPTSLHYFLLPGIINSIRLLMLPA